MTDRNDFTEFWGEPISVYTSAQAESDGILIKTGNPKINYMTHTVYERLVKPFVSENINDAEIVKKLIEEAIIKIRKIGKPDWFYAVDVRDCRLFVALNETGAYTIMFPEDY